MMKILIVSDSHGDNLALRKIANKHNDCDYYLHLGDSEALPEEIKPFISTKGNCDFCNDFQKNLIIDTPKGKLYAEHIPFYQIKINELIKQGYTIYLCGHTHTKKDEEISGIRVINPGSISYPRDGQSSYAILEIDSNSVKTKFYNYTN